MPVRSVTATGARGRFTLHPREAVTTAGSSAQDSNVQFIQYLYRRCRGEGVVQNVDRDNTVSFVGHMRYI